MNNMIRALSLASLVFTSGCAAIGIAAANFPSRFDDVVVERDIAYGAEKDQKLDIYQLPATAGNKRDVLVFLYGGRWTSGKKEEYAFVGSAFAKAGYVVVIPDYRKYPDIRFPVFVQDAAKSIAWASSHIDAYGGNADRIFVAGHSSGAHLGALVAADSRYLNAEGKDRSIIKAFAGLAGPYSFVPEDPDLKDMFAPPENYPNMQVPHFIDGRQPPMLLLHGESDETVVRLNLDKLENAIHEKGGCVKTKIYPGIDHIWIVGSLSWLGKNKAPVLADMTDFFGKKCDDSK